MFTLAAFADEISPDLLQQLQVLQAEGIRFIELRSVWGKGVLDLSDEEVRRIKAELDAHGMGISAIGSPIGKIRLSDPFEPHLERFRRALDLAAFFGCEYVRLFSFYAPEGEEDPAPYRDQVLERMWALDRAAAGYAVTLAHENETGIYGDTPERGCDLLRTLTPGRWVAVFDPENYVRRGVLPFDDAYPLLRPFIGYFHIKDARRSPHEITPAGQGDGQIPQLLQAAKVEGKSCFLSLEPHLSLAGQFSGFSGPRMFAVAAEALRRVVADIGAEWC